MEGALTMAESAGYGPLAGMKVVELAHIMSGPTCGMMLADMGADVIKVEKPDGDDSRRFLPPAINGEPAAFMMMNRNKRGIVVDLKTEEGKNVLRRLVAQCDVLIENFRRGTMEDLGLGYEVLKADNPGLIYAEISGFGRTGPYADRPGFDLIAQGMSGLMAITGEGPGRPPVKVGAPVTDIVAGMLAAMGVCAAYANKLQTGQGQKVDTSLFEAGIVLTYWQSAIAFATGGSPGPMGSAHPLNAPYQAFRTADGWINVGAANQRNWERLIGVLDRSDLQDDPRFSSNQARMGHLDALTEALDALFSQQSSAHWIGELEAAGVPVGPVLGIAEMHRDPQAIARVMVPEVDHPVAGRVKTLGAPVKFSGTDCRVCRPAPTLGEHSREILREFGYADAYIAELIEKGVIGG
jgi:crotonobetainyl-CoA:carnitine CoA-transferase CaiB-like acyl-CoA transferase